MQELQHGDPRSVGRFRIVARVGSGGMAIVYLGRSAGGRTVAVKMMHAEFVDDPEHRDRFRREVAATRAVGGPYCPGVLDADPDASRPWMATEFLTAVSLREAVRRFGALPADSVWFLAAGLAEALTSIHRAGFAHLDLKPANVLLTANGPRVIDFGIAADLRTGRPVSHRPGGTRGFMSPEQEGGTWTGPPSDVFSFGSTLAYACTGAPPADGFLPIADGGLRTMIADCLRSDPAARPELPELVGQLTSPVNQGRRLAWPPPVAAEIDRRIAEAENPPVAVPGRPDDETPVGRRRALLYGAGVLIVGVGVSALILNNGGSGSPSSSAAPRSNGPPQPTLATSSAASSPATPAAQSRVLEIFLTGDATLTSLTYTVNGETKALKNIKLPWRTAIDIPEYPPSSPWRIRYRHKSGVVTYRVMVDKIMQGYGGGGPGTSGGGEGTA